MSFPRYPKYKDSGLAWLGQVPCSWAMKRLRFVGRLNPSKSETAGLPRDTEVSFLPMEAVGDDGSLVLNRTRPLAEVESGYTYFRDGDVTVATITPCFENGKGAVMRGLHGGIGFGTTELTVMRPHAEQGMPEYLHWLFTSAPFRQLGEASMYGAGGQKRVSDDFIRDFAIALPEPAEQAAIAAFLDREAGKMDELVAEQERLIALLKEKRQAVISQAVTKGLNPNAPIKPSGIEWLGDVPAHWDVRRVKHLTKSIEQGWSPQCEGFPAEGDEWAVLKVGCVNGGRFVRGENKVLPQDLEPPSELALMAGDLLVSRANTRELVGSAAVVLGDEPRLLLCDKLYRLRLETHIADPEFLAYYFSTPGARGQIELDATGASASMINIGQASILEMAIAIPPIGEQQKIVQALMKESLVMDQLATEAGRTITLLKERRSALISAAVTGQIDARSLAA